MNSKPLKKNETSDRGTASPKDVELSQQHGREHVAGKKVSREPADYGWEGAGSLEPEKIADQISTQHKSAKEIGSNY
jgi:hypothetical protein